MKKALLQLLIFLFAASMPAQEKSVNEETPKIIFSNIKWSHREDWRVFERSDFPTNSNNPNVINSTTMTVQKRNYFLYQVSIKNETGRTVKGFSYDLVFLKKTDGTESGRLEFSYFLRPFKKNKRMPTEASGNPPTRVVDANEADDPTKSLNVNAEIKCVMFEDNTIWRRQGLPENACNELKESVKQREEFLKRRGY